ncbi:MAG: SelT/SelW/SelH family protein [Chitinivibrionales bacterium]|nr:SelT/SelW/SelH family protein [Chitinivibrionales bacterium]
MAEELKKKFNAESELIESSGGVFEVEMDNDLIFSKKKLNRFPEEGEIATLVSQNK